jgi:hypothetical protein
MKFDVLRYWLELFLNINLIVSAGRIDLLESALFEFSWELVGGYFGVFACE